MIHAVQSLLRIRPDKQAIASLGGRNNYSATTKKAGHPMNKGAVRRFRVNLYDPIICHWGT
jgi:hypothetical protein